MSSPTSLRQLLCNRVWDLKKIEQFLTQDSSCVNEGDRFNFTPLWLVLTDTKCSVDMVRLLLRFGANVNCRDAESYPPLHAAIGFGDVSIVRVLLEAGADVNALGSRNTSALCVALQRGASINLIRLLLECVDVSTYACGKHGSAMHCAMTSDIRTPRSEPKVVVVKLLIDAGASMNETNAWERSPMCVALQKSPAACDIEQLVKAGLSLFACKRHNSPFLCVTELYSENILKPDVVQLLLKSGFTINVNDQLNCTPLQRALKDTQAETRTIRLLFNLCNTGPNDVKGSWGSSLLALAIQNRYHKMSYVKFLLKQGAQVKNVNQLGNTALHLAVRNNDATLIEFLLKHFSLNVNAVNGYSKTPLRVAVENKTHINVLQVLLAADARIKDGKAVSLLEVFLNRYKHDVQHYYKYVQILIKFSLLEIPDFDIQTLIQGHKDHQILSLYEEDCKRELQQMETKIVGQGQSLRTFLSGHFLPQEEKGQFDPVNYGIFKRLLAVVAEDEFPLYFEAFSIRIHRSSMKAKLEKIIFYTVKRESTETKIILDYASVCEIVEHLSNYALVSLIFAFHNEGDNASMRRRRRENIRKMNLEGKRRHKESDEVPKRPRLL